MVELHRGTADGLLIASGECEADDEAPTGYTGRAAIMAVVSDALGDNSATIVRAQTFAGGIEEIVVSRLRPLFERLQAPVPIRRLRAPCARATLSRSTIRRFVVLLAT